MARKERSQLTSAERRAWMHFSAVVMLLPQALDLQLKRDAGMNSFEFGILAALEDAPGQRLQMSDLARWTNGSLSRLSHAVSRLEQAEWVKREASPSGGRRTDVQLTAAGRRQLQLALPGHSAEVRRLVIDALPDAALDALDDAARRMLLAIDGDLAAMFEERIASLD